MCYWCNPDNEPPDYASLPDGKQFHDMWLFPHGRYGYTPAEKITASMASCPWCVKSFGVNASDSPAAG